MSRRATEPGEGQAGLFVVDGRRPTRTRAGRHELAVGRALDDLDEPIADRYAVAVTTLRALCRSLDVAEDKGDAYAAAQLAPRVVELLDRLGLAPEPVVDDDDDDDVDDQGFGAAE